MSGSDGSTALNDEQADWFKQKHGVRYLHVQTVADVPSRRARRAAGQRQRLHGQGLRIVSPKALWKFVEANA